jgi:hypothetical protein
MDGMHAGRTSMCYPPAAVATSALKGPSRPELPAALTMTTPLLMAFFITGLNTLCRHTNTCGGGSSGSGCECKGRQQAAHKGVFVSVLHS